MVNPQAGVWVHGISVWHGARRGLSGLAARRERGPFAHGWAMAANPAKTILAGAEMGARFGLRFCRSKLGSLLGSRMGWQRQRSAQAAQRGIVQLHPPTIQAGEIIHDRQAKP